MLFTSRVSLIYISPLIWQKSFCFPKPRLKAGNHCSSPTHEVDFPTSQRPKTEIFGKPFINSQFPMTLFFLKMRNTRCAISRDSLNEDGASAEGLRNHHQPSRMNCGFVQQVLVLNWNLVVPWWDRRGSSCGARFEGYLPAVTARAENMCTHGELMRCRGIAQ